jgi:hypothetical protein
MHHSTAPSLPPHAEASARAEMPAQSEHGPPGGLAAVSPAGREAYAPRRPVLDLRAPDSKLDPGADAEVPFPSRPRLFGGTEAPEFHFQDSRVKQIAEHFHREGLPVARLWETHSALLSLGLNHRGKPGLWLVQKTH